MLDTCFDSIQFNFFYLHYLLFTETQQHEVNLKKPQHNITETV